MDTKYKDIKLMTSITQNMGGDKKNKFFYAT